MTRTNNRTGSKRKSDLVNSSGESTVESRTNKGTGSKRKLDLDTSRSCSVAVPVKFFVIGMTNQLIPIEMMSSDKCYDIKKKIIENAVLKVITPDGIEILSYQMPQRFAEWGMEKLPTTFRLLYNGKQISDDPSTLSEMGIYDGATVHLMQCLCGC